LVAEKTANKTPQNEAKKLRKPEREGSGAANRREIALAIPESAATEIEKSYQRADELNKVCAAMEAKKKDREAYLCYIFLT
jgi:hypothetical protein